MKLRIESEHFLLVQLVENAGGSETVQLRCNGRIQDPLLAMAMVTKAQDLLIAAEVRKRNEDNGGEKESDLIVPPADVTKAINKRRSRN
tara:strand:+ start:83 stop:349 length:267 start_codon:yes stop_codon:yes gene_type:complete